MRKRPAALALTVLMSWFTAISSPAADGCSMGLNSRIDGLFENADQDIRIMETSVLKAEISDDYIGNVDGGSYIPCCTIDAREDCLYRMSAAGAGGRIAYSEKDGKYTVGISQHTEEQGRRNESDIGMLCDFVDNVSMAAVGLSEMDRISMINQILCDTLSYNYEKDTSKPVEAIRTKKATCLGYAGLFYLLCINSGISCEIVGNGMHAFNRITMADSSVYYVDACWNDTEDDPNRYFMLTEDGLNALEDGSHGLADCFRKENEAVR